MSELKAPPQPAMELVPMCPECRAQWAPGPDHGMSADSWLDEHGHPHTWPEDEDE